MPAMFQHRHYKAIADVLADTRDDLAQGAGERQYSQRMSALSGLEDRLVQMFKADNYGFSPDRFRAAAQRAPGMHGKDKVR